MENVTVNGVTVSSEDLGLFLFLYLTIGSSQKNKFMRTPARLSIIKYSYVDESLIDCVGAKLCLEQWMPSEEACWTKAQLSDVSGVAMEVLRQEGIFHILKPETGLPPSWSGVPELNYDQSGLCLGDYDTSLQAFFDLIDRLN